MTEIEEKFLEHTALGTNWKDHKYLYIDKNGRYIYPEDVKNGGGAKYGSKEYEQMTARSGKTINTRSSINTPAKKSSTTSNTTKSSSPSVTKTDQAAASIANTTDKKTEEKKTTSTKKKSTTKKTSTKASKEATELGLTENDLKALTSNINTEATQRDEVINSLALKVIRGDFGNGQDRKNKLGQYYSVIQKRVNELMKTMSKGKKTSVKKKTTQKSTTSKSTKSVKYGSDDYYKQTGKSGTTVNNRKTVKHSDEEEFLIHWGIKKRSGRYAYGSGDRPYQHDPTARKKHKDYDKKHRRKMSDDELDYAIQRTKKEVELAREQNNNMDRGEKFIKEVMYDIGKKAATTAGTALLLYMGKAMVEGYFDKEGFAGALVKTGKNK